MRLAAEIGGRHPGIPGCGERRDSRARSGAAGEPAGAGAIPPGELSAATDDMLVRTTVAGQKEAFAELVRRYTKLLYWHVGGCVSDPVEVEEITQEAMVRAYVDLPRLRAPGAFASWLLAIASCALRRKGRRDSRMLRLDMEDARQVAADAPTPPEVLSDEEFRARLLDEMRRLPDHYKVAVVLKYMNGCSVKEIAERLHIPAGTVRARLSRAYAILQGRLERERPAGSAEPRGAGVSDPGGARRAAKA